ncbi:MAG: hypothetical protein ABFC34_01495 [Methanobacterium sp.]
MAELTDFVHDGKTITLKTPLALDIVKIDGYFYASNEEIELCADGKTEEDAINNARDIFSNLYILSKKVIQYVEG